MKKHFAQFRDLDLSPLNPEGVSFLFGTNFPHLILHRDFRSEEPHQPCAAKTLWGWVLMGGKGLGKYLNFNFISTPFDLEQFYYLENCETLPKTH